MTGWVAVLILSLAGSIVILLRRLPKAIQDSSLPASPAAPGVTAPTPAKNKAKKSGARAAASPPAPDAANLKLDELSTDGLIERAQAAFAARDFSRAREFYELLTARERDPKWWTRLGVVNMELERFREARDAFRAALRFGADVASRHTNLGLAEYALGHRVTAIGHLRKAIALSPNTKRYQELLESIESNE